MVGHKTGRTRRAFWMLGFSLIAALGAPARADDASDQMTSMLTLFLSKYPDTLETWQETNGSLSTIADAATLFTKPERAFVFGASIAAGASVGALAGQGITALVTLGGEALFEAITHRRRDAEWLQACTDLRPELEKSEAASWEAEKQLRAEILMRRIIESGTVSAGEVLRKLSIQRIQVEADRRDAQIRFDSLNRSERELLFADTPSIEEVADLGSRKSLVAEDIADFDAWLTRNARTTEYLRALDGGPAPDCAGMAKDWNQLVSRERDQQNARALILRGESVWMKAKSRESRQASDGLKSSRSRASIRNEKQTLARELKRLEKRDLVPLLRELKLLRTRAIRTCLDRPGAEADAITRYRIRYGRFASDARLAQCTAEFESSEGKRVLDSRIEPIRERIRRTESAIDALDDRADPSVDGSADLHRMAIESDLAWFASVRERHDRIELSRAGELVGLCGDIAETGCAIPCQ